MSLLDDSMEKCILMNRQTVDDGYGGYKNIWSNGVNFSASFVVDESTLAQIAEKLGVTEKYTITTRRVMTLNANDYIQRVRDGKYFHITSNGGDMETPESAGLDMRVVTAEVVTALPR